MPKGRLASVLKVLIQFAIALVLSTGLIQPTQATERDPKQRAEFKRANPCPATGKGTGACPGYVMDHIRPLCAGGPDTPANMQWQTVAEAKEKDRLEARECRELRRAGRKA